MLPRLHLAKKDIENYHERYLRNHRYTLRNSTANRNVSHFINSARNLKYLKEDEIIDDKTFQIGIANIISRFIVEEISDKVSSVILKPLIFNSLREIYHNLEER